MSRNRTIALRSAVLALLIVSAFWGSLRAYDEYKAYRAESLLAVASRIQMTPKAPSYR
jgi:cytoplasmic iron level regulating protein YaaA (DUF328/UPF0246 family)